MDLPPDLPSYGCDYFLNLNKRQRETSNAPNPQVNLENTSKRIRLEPSESSDYSASQLPVQTNDFCNFLDQAIEAIAHLKKDKLTEKLMVLRNEAFLTKELDESSIGNLKRKLVKRFKTVDVAIPGIERFVNPIKANYLRLLAAAKSLKENERNDEYSRICKEIAFLDLEKAINISKKITDEDLREKTLGFICRKSIKYSNFEMALIVYREVIDPQQRDLLAKKFAEKLALKAKNELDNYSEEDSYESLSFACAIEDKSLRMKFFRELYTKLLYPTDCAALQDTVDEIPSAHSSIIEELMKKIEKERIQNKLREFVPESNRSDDDVYRSIVNFVQPKLYFSYSEEAYDRVKVAKKIARLIEDAETQNSVLDDIIYLRVDLLKYKDIEQAIKVTRKFISVEIKEQALQQLFKFCVLTKLFEAETKEDKIELFNLAEKIIEEMSNREIKNDCCSTLFDNLFDFDPELAKQFALKYDTNESTRSRK